MMRQEPDRIAVLLTLLAASRNLERVADHATNIAEDVIYMVEGEIVRHQPEVYSDDVSSVHSRRLPPLEN